MCLLLFSWARECKIEINLLPFLTIPMCFSRVSLSIVYYEKNKIKNSNGSWIEFIFFSVCLFVCLAVGSLNQTLYFIVQNAEIMCDEAKTSQN